MPSVPLQQELRTQQRAFANLFAGRGRYPRFKSQDGDRKHRVVHRGSAEVDAYFGAYFLRGERPEKRTVHVPQLGDPVPPSQSSARTLTGTVSPKAARLKADVIR